MVETVSIGELVRDGRASPKQAALLLELRRDSAERNKVGRFAQLLTVMAALVTALFVRRNS